MFLPKEDKMQQNLIHKVHITPEAVFDYEECMKLDVAPKKDIKNEIEDYLYIKQREGQIINQYFRIKYYDEKSDEMLMLFVKKGHMFANMQMWLVVGICLAEDYDEQFEDAGVNKSWYDSKIDITGLPKTDWVKNLNTESLSALPKGKITGLSKEERDAVIYGGNKGIIKALPFLQRSNRKRNSRKGFGRKNSFSRNKH
jgi:hypothetical protein